jgi:hypothetical protein
MPDLESLQPSLSRRVAQQGVADIAGGSMYSGVVTGESAGDVAFGGPTADFILYGVVNGAFAQGPADPDNDIDPQNNPMPYWNGPTQVSGGAITCRWVEDASSPSGYNLRFTINPGAASDEAYFEQIIPIGGSRWRWTAQGLRATVTDDTGTATFKIAAQYLKADGTTTGSAMTSTITAAGAPRTLAMYPPLVTPTSASLLRIRIGVERGGMAAGASGLLDFTDVRSTRAVDTLLLGDIGGGFITNPGQISQSAGVVSLTAGGVGALGTAALTLSTSAATIPQAIIYSGVIAATISGNQNDYAPTGIATCSFIGFTVSGAARTITGWDATGFTEGQTFSISTAGGNDLVFPHASASSLSGNRISSANSATLTVRSGGGCTFIYVPSYSAANPFRIIAANA